jgi:cytochrome c
MWTTTDSASVKLTVTESADIFAYLYSTLYFAPPGDTARGKAFFEKNCAGCHGESGPGAAILSWKSVTDPFIWAERMWNHSDEMHTASSRKGLTPPSLSSQDVADLLIYFRSIPALRAQSSTFRAGEPEQGLLVFERSCESCHSFGPGPTKKIDFLSRRPPSTITGYIAAMWNHAVRMRGPTGQRPTKLEAGEMSNLVAFLFSQSYFFQRGDEVRGRQVFETKKCAQCHEEHKKETGAPDLTQAFEAYSPITLTAAVWNHGPTMFHTMRQQGISWPEFQGSEMADLIAYLNAHLTRRIALRPN